MNRRVLLLEPNWKNKFPPVNLQKLATYFRCICGDDVRFYKGDLKYFAAQLLLEEFFRADVRVQNLFAQRLNNTAKKFGQYEKTLIEFIRTGKTDLLDTVPNLHEDFVGVDFLLNLHRRFKLEDFPTFDIICVNSLFTFFFDETVRTINYAKNFLTPDGKIFVGGVAATLVPEFFEKETGIKPHIGLLDKPDDLGKSDDIIIDRLPLDYSILDEIEYRYPMSDAYIFYTTRGCIRKCNFCAVRKLEPKYKNHEKIFDRIQQIETRFGMKRNLLLMDNNVLASSKFDEIIDEIKSCGFAKGASYLPPNEYVIALKNLRDSFNERACIKKIICLYDELEKRLSEEIAGKFYNLRAKKYLLSVPSASREKILEIDDFVSPLFEKYFRRNRLIRYVDFNQGLDARLLDEHKMSRLAELNLHPMRIAFDHIEQREIYERAIRLAAKYGIKDLSNYLLYNFLDTPDDFYNRLKINIDLCEELDVAIYSFPMKYCPIDDPEYFRNRDYIGKHWNRKFVRAIQAITNATKGKIGRGREFFEKAFGKNLNEFKELLYMPETFIIYRLKYENNLTKEWRKKFLTLNDNEKIQAIPIIEQNKFSDEEIFKNTSENIREFLKFYQIRRV